MDQQTHTSDVSVSTSAVHKRDREEILPDAPNERTSSDLHTSGSQPGLPSRGGCEDQGTAAGSPLELPATEGARIGEEAHGTVQSVSSGGEQRVIGSILIYINLFQLQRQGEGKERFWVPPHLLMRQHADSMLSNPSCPSFIPTTR